MLDRHAHVTTDTPRRRALKVALALACACGAAFAPTHAAASGTPAPPNARAQAKPGAAKGARARRVVPPPAKTAAPAKEAAAEVPTPRAEVKTEGGTEAGSKSAARPASESSPADAEPKSDEPRSDEPEGGAAKVAAAGGASGVEAELNDLRARIKDARPEERGRLQRALVDRLVALGRKADAQNELRLMIHEDRYDPAFFFNTGNALARLGDANAAADAYRKAVSQRRGNYARALNNLGVVLTRQGRWDEAHDILVAALTQENFTYAEASYNLGRLHLLRGQADLALREWARTLSLQPDHAEAAAALARAYAEDGDAERALAILERFTARAARTGGVVPAEIAYARTAIVESRARGDRGGATPAPTAVGAGARPAASANPPARTAPARTAPARSASPLRLLSVDRLTYAALETARAASERGRHEEAVRHYRTVLSRSGGYLPPANLELSFALISLGRFAEAAASLQALVERDDTLYPVAHYHLARLHERAGQNSLAVERFARAAALYGDTNPQVLLDLSRTREKTGDVRGALEAVEAYAAAISRQGSVPHWVVERADTLRMKAKAAPGK